MAFQRNMDPHKCPMPSQDPAVRAHNFDEVALGYTYDMAVNEARRCLACKNKPCVTGCPVQIDIPAFIERVANEDMEGAYKVLSASSALPAVCGVSALRRTSARANACAASRARAWASADWSGFVADWHREHSTESPEKPVSNGRKVAIIGAGPLRP